MPTLESRITHLERQNRTLRASVLFGVITLVTCGGSSVTSNFQRVNTNTLAVVTGDDRPVITLSAHGTITFADSAAPVVIDAATAAKLVALAVASDSAPSPK